MRLALAGENDHATTVELVQAVQDATGDVGEKFQAIAAKQGISLERFVLADANWDFVLLPRRWMAERSVGWVGHSRGLARNCEHHPEITANLHVVAFAMLMSHRTATSVLIHKIS